MYEVINNDEIIEIKSHEREITRRSPETDSVLLLLVHTYLPGICCWLVVLSGAASRAVMIVMGDVSVTVVFCMIM